MFPLIFPLLSEKRPVCSLKSASCETSVPFHLFHSNPPVICPHFNLLSVVAQWKQQTHCRKFTEQRCSFLHKQNQKPLSLLKVLRGWTLVVLTPCVSVSDPVHWGGGGVPLRHVTDPPSAVLHLINSAQIKENSSFRRKGLNLRSPSSCFHRNTWTAWSLSG